MSLTVVSLVAVTGIGALVAFSWAFFTGRLDDLDGQMSSIFDDVDLRFKRPWESEQQQQERAQAHGPLIDAPPGEWGGTL